MKTAALIVAAGTGTRAGSGTPKQYQPLLGKPIIQHSIDLFGSHPGISQILVVINEAHSPLYTPGNKALPPVIGGNTRQESVRRGLEALAADAPDFVLIHDAARPLMDTALVDRVLTGLKTHKAVIPVLPVTDTLKTVKAGRVETVDRASLHRAQTPQGFHFVLIRMLHEKYKNRDATDDSMLAEWEGIEVGLVPGDERNLKITTPLDLKVAAII